MIQDLGKRMEAKIEKMQEMFNKDLEELRHTHVTSTPIYDKNAPESGHRGNLPQCNKGHI